VCQERGSKVDEVRRADNRRDRRCTIESRNWSGNCMGFRMFSKSRIAIISLTVFAGLCLPAIYAREESNPNERTVETSWAASQARAPTPISRTHLAADTLQETGEAAPATLSATLADEILRDEANKTLVPLLGQPQPTEPSAKLASEATRIDQAQANSHLNTAQRYLEVKDYTAAQSEIQEGLKVAPAGSLVRRKLNDSLHAVLLAAEKSRTDAATSSSRFCWMKRDV